MKTPALGLLAYFAFFINSCQVNQVECDAVCEENWMDGSGINTFDLSESDSSLVSMRTLNSAAKTKPVILAVHGFTASTYEWKEFRAWAEADGAVLVSPVLLGGHGKDIETFRNSTWKMWGAPILREYQKLDSLGFTNISIVASSTGCPLLLAHIAAGAFKNLKTQPKHIFLIDPIVLPSDKLLTLINLAGPILGNSPSEGTAEENKNWYVNRPAEDLSELYGIITKVKNLLEDGIKLPKGTKAKVFKAKIDGSADPVSALLLYKGLRDSDGKRIEVEMIDTRKHVFTRLAGRSSSTAADSALQLKAFEDMKARLLSKPLFP